MGRAVLRGSAAFAVDRGVRCGCLLVLHEGDAVEHALLGHHLVADPGEHAAEARQERVDGLGWVLGDEADRVVPGRDLGGERHRCS